MKLLTILLSASFLLLVGCAVQEESPTEEAAEEAGVEEVEPAPVEDTEQGRDEDDAIILNCQITKAQAAGVDVDELAALVTESGETVPEYLTQQGYTCTRAEAQAVIEAEKAKSKAELKEEHEAAQQKLKEQGVTPGKAADPVRDQCLQEHYKGFSIPQKSEESRRIDAEAKEQGVSVYDVVGC